jgi:uncharacterized lipoprotein
MIRQLLCVFLCFGLLSACADSSSLSPGKGGSTVTVSGRSYDQVWNASIKSVTSLGLAITSSDKSRGIIKAEKGVGLTTWGEVVGVFISPANVKAKHYTVEVQSEKHLQYQITGQDWTHSILEGIKAELKI